MFRRALCGRTTRRYELQGGLRRSASFPAGTQWGQSAKLRRAILLCGAVVAAATWAGATPDAFAAEPKRVLIVNSWGIPAPPSTIHSTSFESEIVARLGERITLDAVALDLARNEEGELQHAMLDYLERRQANWKPDLVVPIGSPAAVFVANNYDRLFPETPLLVIGSNRSFLPPGSWEKNTTFVGHAIDIPAFFEDMFQVAPATKNIEIVLGATSLERSWREAFKKAAAPLGDHVNFTYYNDLSFDQMLERAANLPPDSFIFFMVLLRDAAGVTVKSDDALDQLHRVANAPINSLFVHQVGTGIVGGRLLDGERLGKDAADIAIRILRGEPASSIPEVLLEQTPPRYDWRELRRWKIDEKLLPPGSTVLFREPTVWERYRTWIIAAVSILILQALLISGLLFNLFRRRRAELSLAESEKRFRTMADATPVLIWVTDEDKLVTYFNKASVDFTGLTAEQILGNGWIERVHPDDREKCLQTYRSAFDAREPFAMQYRIRRHDGKYRWINDQGVPRYGPRGNFRGYVGACVDITDLLQKEQELHESEERIALAAEAAQIGVWEFNPDTKAFWASEKWRNLFGFKAEEEVTYEDFRERVHPEDRGRRDALVQQTIESCGRYETEFRIVCPDGTLRWMSGRAHCLPDAHGGTCRLMGVSWT